MSKKKRKLPPYKRIFDKKEYLLISTHGTKTRAKNEANKIRQDGRLARVVSYKSPYSQRIRHAVYYRGLWGR